MLLITSFLPYLSSFFFWVHTLGRVRPTLYTFIDRYIKNSLPLLDISLSPSSKKFETSGLHPSNFSGKYTHADSVRRAH